MYSCDEKVELSASLLQSSRITRKGKTFSRDSLMNGKFKRTAYIFVFFNVFTATFDQLNALKVYFLFYFPQTV